jgi:hypothetical protein
MLGGRTLARQSGSPAEVAIQCIWDGRAWGSDWLAPTLFRFAEFPLRLGGVSLVLGHCT